MKNLTDDELLDELKKRLNTNHSAINECKDLMKQLWFTNKKLEESEAIKSHFISNISNEIINPFTSIIGLSHAIIASKPEDIEKIKNWASLIHSEAFNLDFQLNNIFTAAKLEAGEINLELFQVNIKELVQSTIDSFLIESSKKLLTISVKYEGILKTKAQPKFKTDPHKLKIILSNLISNAIKFSIAGRIIEIKCSINKSMLTVSVKDFGIGIAKKDFGIIFDRFKRLDNSINEQNRGNGLGLSVTKSLLEILGGQINFNSQGKLGTIFEISIPENNLDNNMGDFSNNFNDFLFNG